MVVLVGCSSSSLSVKRGELTISLDMDYLLQKKDFKSLSYDFETGTVTIENFSTDTSEVVSEFLKFLSAPK